MDDDAKAALRARINIKIPGLKRGVGAGELVEKLTKKLGIPTCSDCEKRKQRMDRAVRLTGAFED